MRVSTLVSGLMAMLFASQVQAHHRGGDQLPPPPDSPSSSSAQCMSQQTVLPVDDQAVLNFEQTTQTNFLARAHVSGPIVEVLPDETGHAHFMLQLGDTPDQAVEVIYSQEFGTLPTLTAGMRVEACGDYITVTPGSSGTEGDGPGILHWVHGSDTASHDSGFVAIGGVVYGEGSGN